MRIISDMTDTTDPACVQLGLRLSAVLGQTTDRLTIADMRRWRRLRRGSRCADHAGARRRGERPDSFPYFERRFAMAHLERQGLPWCRITKNLAATIDQDAARLKSIDAWYDPQSGLDVRLVGDRYVCNSPPYSQERVIDIEVLEAFRPVPADVWASVLAARANVARLMDASLAPPQRGADNRSPIYEQYLNDRARASRLYAAALTRKGPR